MVLLKFKGTWPVSIIHWSVVLWRARKPNWLALSRPPFSMCLWTIFWITVSNSLPVVYKRLIGLNSERILGPYRVSVTLFNFRVRLTLRLAVYRQSVLATSPLRLTTSTFFFQLNICSHSPSVTSSLTRGWVCRLQLLLVLASAVILKSESRGIHDHVLLSQIRDFPNMWDQVPVFISSSNRVAQLYPQTLGSLFFASYDSQGYGGGIRTRHHTEYFLLNLSRSFSLYSLGTDGCVRNRRRDTCLFSIYPATDHVIISQQNTVGVYCQYYVRRYNAEDTHHWIGQAYIAHTVV
jgi:hypothetical protein